MRTEVLDAISKSVSQSKEATLKRLRRLEDDEKASERDRRQARRDFDLLVEAANNITEAQAKSLS